MSEQCNPPVQKMGDNIRIEMNGSELTIKIDLDHPAPWERTKGGFGKSRRRMIACSRGSRQVVVSNPDGSIEHSRLLLNCMLYEKERKQDKGIWEDE